jgi:glycerophosphoryl diester phosphodiesterase
MGLAGWRFAPLPWTLGAVAHRGLHDEAAGVIENTPSAFEAAIAHGFAIETDIQAAADDEPVIFHDAVLERLTQGEGALAAFTPAALKATPFRAGSGCILSLAEFLELVGGAVPVYLEIKTAGDGAPRLARKIADVLASYSGPAAVMSFDPLVVAAMRQLAPQRPRGIVSMRFTKAEFPAMPAHIRFRLTHLLDFPAARPTFLAYHVGDLPRPAVSVLRRAGLPVLAWTVRSERERRRALAYADAMIFEGLRP